MNHLLKAGILVLTVIVSACSSTVKDVFHNTKPTSELPTSLVIVTNELSSWDVSIQKENYTVESDLARALALTNPSVPVSSPNVIGGVEGVALNSAISVLSNNRLKSRAQILKNKPVMQLLSRLKSRDWSHLLGQTLANATRYDSYINNVNPETLANSIKVTPNLEVTGNYLSLEMHSLVEVFEKNKKIYSNYFHVQSEPIIRQKMTLADLDNENVEVIDRHVEKMFLDLLVLVEKDFNSFYSVLGLSPRAIRFNNHMGSYYERGYLFEETPSSMTFKSLRGEVKYYPKS